MAILGFELEEIARLMALMEARGLEELVIEEGDRYLRIRGPRPPKAARPPSLPFPEEMTGTYPAISAPRPRKRRQQALPSGVPDDRHAPSADQIVLASPMVGTFYRAE
jgi:biotin carboxyl carrier protein